MRTRVSLLAVLLLGIGSSLSAQTPTAIDGTSGIAFQASPDHVAVNDDGTAVVDHYELLVIRQNNGALFFTQGLLKPAPDGQGVILVKPISNFATLTRGVVYVAKVQAVGPGGAGVSGLSDPFQVPFAPAKVPAAPGVPVPVR